MFDIFGADFKDIVFMWRHNPLIEPTMEKEYPEALKDYLAIIEEFRKVGWGIYDTVTALPDMVQICDAYYGDNDKVVQRFVRTGKSTMIEDADIDNMR